MPSKIIHKFLNIALAILSQVQPPRQVNQVLGIIQLLLYGYFHELLNDYKTVVILLFGQESTQLFEVYSVAW